MGVGYAGTLQRESDTELIVLNGIGQEMGWMRWNEEWDCYVFTPREGTFYGPVFLSWLAFEMHMMETIERKRLSSGRQK